MARVLHKTNLRCEPGGRARRGDLIRDLGRDDDLDRGNIGELISTAGRRGHCKVGDVVDREARAGGRGACSASGVEGAALWEGLKEGGCRSHWDLDEDEGEVVAQVGCAGCDDGDGGQKVDGFDRLSESSLSPERTIEWTREDSA